MNSNNTPPPQPPPQPHNDTSPPQPPTMTDMMSMFLKQLQIQQEQSKQLIDLLAKQEKKQEEQSNQFISLMTKVEQYLDRTSEIDVAMSKITDSAWHAISHKLKLYESYYDFPITTKTSLLISFEIKKGPLGSNDHNQSKAQLLAANSGSKDPVLSVLTDLGNCWSFKWLTKPNSTSTDIAITQCNSPQIAFEIIYLFLDRDSMKINLMPSPKNLVFTSMAKPVNFTSLAVVGVANLKDLERCLPDEEVQDTYVQASIMSYFG